jgi:hypothetical protein
MSVTEWSKSTVHYGCKLVDSAVEGALEGEGEFLQRKSLDRYLGESARRALAPAVLGACLGAACGWLVKGRRSPARAVAYGLAGAAIGFGAGLIWESMPLTACAANKAWKRVARTRDEHWLENNPIDYA